MIEDEEDIKPKKGKEKEQSAFFLVFCKNRKKFDKYAKLNRIRNKYVIDIASFQQEEEASRGEYYFKILVMRRIQEAVEKNRNVYYIPDFSNPNINVDSLVSSLEKVAPEYDRNLLMFYDDFTDEASSAQAVSMLDRFEAVQILKDY